MKILLEKNEKFLTIECQFTKRWRQKPDGERFLRARNGRFHHSRRIPPIDLKNRRTFTPFTSYRLVLGKLAEGSDKLAPRIGFWAQDLDKKNFLRLGSLRERKFQGKKPKSFVHLLLEK